MHEQKLLFHLQEIPWIEQLWRRVPAEKRRLIATILAEMAKSAVAGRPSGRQSRPPQEARDER